MGKRKHITGSARIKKFLPALIMFACLFLLTGANFVIYPSSISISKSAGGNQSSQNDPQGPVEEKPGTGSNTGLSIQEEYVHEHHHLHCLATLILTSNFYLGDSEDLEEVHSDLLTPPPKQC